ncbi:hypothetical protein KU6B_19180 [Mameliella alba]|nr:hypothetical protein KU6B_19180 [Mameliella alba]
MAVPIDPTVIPETIAKYRAAGAWSDQSLLSAFTAAVKSTPEKTATVDPDGNRRSYAEVERAGRQPVGPGCKHRRRDLGPTAQMRRTVDRAHRRAQAGAVTNPLLTNYRAKELS